ncbi:hypothetical protein Q8A73_007168 [Channa argus]|nr:hypothetical protein Q8A73_007168 [Channa argus]
MSVDDHVGNKRWRSRSVVRVRAPEVCSPNSTISSEHCTLGVDCTHVGVTSPRWSSVSSARFSSGAATDFGRCRPGATDAPPLLVMAGGRHRSLSPAARCYNHRCLNVHRKTQLLTAETEVEAKHVPAGKMLPPSPELVNFNH